MPQPAHHAVATPLPVRAGDDAEMFELAPVSLWLEDFSAVKAKLDSWRRAGVRHARLPALRSPAGSTSAKV